MSVLLNDRWFTVFPPGHFFVSLGTVSPFSLFVRLPGDKPAKMPDTGKVKVL
jgi:hypothetical protein